MKDDLMDNLQSELEELEMLEDANSDAEENGFGKYCILLKQAIRRITEVEAQRDEFKELMIESLEMADCYPDHLAERVKSAIAKVTGETNA